MDTFGSMLKYLRQRSELTQQEFADKIGKSKSIISMYENGNRKPDYETLEVIADFFNIDVDKLMCRDDNQSTDKAFADAILIEMPESVLIPVYGKIRAGVPLEAIEDVEEHIDVPAKWIQSGRKIIGLKVDGDSMYPKYFDGDIVVLECDIDYYSGDDCAVYVNGYEATIKQIKWIDDGIELIPINTTYPPKKYQKDEFSILGKVIEMRRRF